MATTVVAVVIFLCGVLVGRGVRPSTASGTASAASIAPAPVPVESMPSPAATAGSPPPAPPATAEDLSYHKRLQVNPGPPEAAAADEKLKTQETEPPKPVDPPVAKASAPPPGPEGGWVVQIAALRDRAAADAIVRRLTAKGYPTFMLETGPGTPAPGYRVRVGRAIAARRADRAAAGERRAIPSVHHSLAPPRSACPAVRRAPRVEFPEIRTSSSGMVALAPLLVTLPDLRPRRAFTLGFLTGAVYFWGTLYWLVAVMTTFGGLNTAAAAGSATLLIIYLSVSGSVRSGWPGCAHGSDCGLWHSCRPSGSRQSSDGYACGWLSMGAPRLQQATVLPVAQLASIVGVFGVSFLVASVSAALTARGSRDVRCRWPPRLRLFSPLPPGARGV